MHGWLNRISPSAGALLTAAAILGEDASYDRLRQLTALPGIKVAGGLDDLLRAELLHEHGTPSPKGDGPLHYRFTHELVSEVVADAAGPNRARLLHRRALDALGAEGVSAGRLAHHALLAGLPDEGFRHSLAAAIAAMSRTSRKQSTR